MTTPRPPGIETPDAVESRLGTLRFFDGFSDDATTATLAPVNRVAIKKGYCGSGPRHASSESDDAAHQPQR